MLPSLEMLVSRHQAASLCTTNTRESTRALLEVNHWRNITLTELKLSKGGLVLKANQKCKVFMGDTEVMRWNAMYQNIDMKRFEGFNFTITTTNGEVEIFQVVNGEVQEVLQAEERLYS